MFPGRLFSKKTRYIFTLFIILFFTASVYALPSVPAIQPSLNPAFWQGFRWRVSVANGITFSNQANTIIFSGTATNSFWNSEARLVKRFNGTRATVDIALSNLPATASAGSIWLAKDSQNALIVEKHRDVTDPQYNTNLFIVERVNGVDSFKFVSPDLPSSSFDTFSIEKNSSGYNVYYHSNLVYTGTLNVSTHNRIEFVGIARATGDQVNAQFRAYTEQ